MTQEKGFFALSDKTDIFYQAWLPEAESCAALIVVHGVAEHSGRYMNLVNELVPQGFSVYGLDHYGHGKSGGRRLFVPDFNLFTEALDRLVDKVREWEKGKPLYLVGHSMGGLITASYLLDHQDKLSGTILSGPGVKVPGHVSAMTLMAARIFSKLMPGLGIKQLDANDISRDPAVVRAYVNDPLVSTGKLTARLGEQILGACMDVTERAPLVRLPLLILHGSCDALVDPDGSREFHDRVSSSDKTLIFYPDRFHEIFNDPGHDQVFADMKAWLAERI